MRKAAAARFCGDCGYEFARDSTGDECPICPRFEQLRTEFAVPRPSELARLHSRPEERLDANHPVASADRLPTASEYRALLAASRASIASANGGSGGPVATVIRTPSLRHPAEARMGASTAVLTRGSPAPPKKPAARRKDRPTATLTRGSPAPPKKPAARRKDRPPATLTRGSPAPPKKPAARRKDRPTATLTRGSPARPTKPRVAEGEPEPAMAEIQSSAAAVVEHTPAAGIEIAPVRSRRRAMSRDDDTAFELIEASPEPVAAAMEPEPVAAAVEPEPKPGTWRNDRRPTPPPTQDTAGIWSVAEPEIMARYPEAHRVMGAQAVRHHAAPSRRRAVWEAAIGAVVGVTSALIGTSLALLLS